MSSSYTGGGYATSRAAESNFTRAGQGVTQTKFAAETRGPLRPTDTTQRVNTNSSFKEKSKRDDGDILFDDNNDNALPPDYIVPGAMVNAEVIIHYVTQYFDRHASITWAQHATVSYLD